MGAGRWDPDDWRGYTSTAGYATKSAAAIFTSRGLDPSLDPKGVIRESRDSADNPLSTPLIVALDVTGSMGVLAETMAREGLNTLVTEVYNRKPITDPHILCAGIGDAEMGDRAPLQVTQFEADLRIAKQLELIFIEHGGGGNRYESYTLAWLFAARHTVTDAWEKRQRKGYLFTIGDEEATPLLRVPDIERVLGDHLQADVETEALLTEVARQWEVFHIMVAEGSHAQAHPDAVRKSWTHLLGQRALWLADHKKLAEVLVSTIQIVEGDNRDDVIRSWDGTTAMVVGKATEGLIKRSGTTGADGLVTL